MAAGKSFSGWLASLGDIVLNSSWVASMMASGTFAATGASAVTVADANVTANSIVMFTLKTVGGTVGAIPAVKTITPGTGFTVAATASDTSIYNYRILG